MKKLFITTILLGTVWTSNLLLAQNTYSGDLTLGWTVPIGDTRDLHKGDFSVGMSLDYTTPCPSVHVLLGFEYIGLAGAASGFLQGDDIQIYSIFVNPRLGAATGLYIEPIGFSFNVPLATSHKNWSDAWDGKRFGLNFGMGYLFPIPDVSSKMDVGVTFSTLNVFGKEEFEDTIKFFKISTGVHF